MIQALDARRGELELSKAELARRAVDGVGYSALTTRRSVREECRKAERVAH